MRIRLKRGFQKKLIAWAKSDLTWKGLAKKLGINESYLKIDLNMERRLLSEDTYKRLCVLAKKDYGAYIVERLGDNWGRSVGGKKASEKQNPALLIKKPSKDLAELIGIILGDGNLWVKPGGYHYVRICGDNKRDKEYLEKYVYSLIYRLFGVKMRFFESKRSNALYLVKGSRDMVFTLNKFGIPSGNKLKNNVSIPSWILNSKEYTRACIRGLMDTDGSVTPITGRDYPYIWFSCNIENLRKSFDIAMKNLEFKTSKWNIREGHAAEKYIGNKEDIARFLKEIGFHNPKHQKKISPR